MAPKPPRFMNDVYSDFPDDDDTTKTVLLQAARLSYPGYGDRHVLLQWWNGEHADGSIVTQIIQLSGMPGNYAYYSPLAEKKSVESSLENTFFSLGEFTRVQRDRILALANAVRFEKTSTINSCRTWTSDLLEAMVNEGLLEN